MGTATESAVTIAGKVPEPVRRLLKYLAFRRDTTVSAIVTSYVLQGLRTDGLLDNGGNVLVTVPGEVTEV